MRVPEHPTSGKRICAVLVSFHPDPGLPARVELILAQVGALVLVDNGSSERELGMLEPLAADPRIAVVANGKNLGVARALNIGTRRAAERGYEWALLLDQDSVVDAGMVDELVAVHASFPDPAHLAVLGAGFRDVHRPDSEPGTPHRAGEPHRAGTPHGAGTPHAAAAAAAPSEAPWEEVESVITSGSLLSLATLARLGAFREDFFIDYVDADFCFRARAQGYRVIRTRKPLMSHAIGASTRHAILGIRRWTSNHSAERRYYIARNDTVMLKEHAQLPWGVWALKSLGRRVRTCKKIVLYEDSKLRKVGAVAHGWWDGVRGHLGPRPRPGGR